jgi:hypothetical protein
MAGIEWWRSVRDVDVLHRLIEAATRALRQKTALIADLERRLASAESRSATPDVEKSPLALVRDHVEQIGGCACTAAGSQRAVVR